MKRKEFVEKAAYVVALAGPLSSITQAWEIWMRRRRRLPRDVDAIDRREVPLIISNALWMACEAVIMVGAFLFDTDLL